MKSYEKMKPKFTKMAGSWSNRTGLPVQDFLSECSMAHFKCKANFKPGKGCFEAFVMSTAWKMMKNYAEQFNTENFHPWEADHWQITDYESPEKTTGFRLALEQLSADSKDMVAVILDSNEDFAAIFKQVGRITTGTIRTYFRQLKWSHTRIDNAFTEIREVIC